MQGGLLALICVLVYSNNFRHDFFLDDFHSIRDNIGLRSLANIPHFFTDAGLFSRLVTNVDYRPILLITYALNHGMAGYETPVWHATQILFHFACTLGILFLARRVLQQAIPPQARERETALALIPLAAALLFAVHPTGSGVVNYMSARSSLLTAAFLLPSIVLYMTPREDPRYGRAPWVAVLLYALALLTKIEAIGALAVYFLYEVWQTARGGGHRRSFLGDLGAALNGGTLRRLWPFLAVSAGYAAVRAKLMAPFPFADTRGATGVGPLDYLFTQTVVWWAYVGKWFAPVGLVADHGDYPVYRSLVDGPVFMAVLAWGAVAAVLLAAWRTRPWLAFLAISALALLSPTSSIAPLSEMLNEHRPYLPLAILSLVWILPVGILLVRSGREQPRAAAAAVAALLLLTTGLGAMTLQRNRAFSTERAYLEDILGKAPSGRALMNYGLIRMGEGDWANALHLYTRALEYSPGWHYLHTNLAILHRTLGDSDRSRAHFDRSVELDVWSGQAVTWRGDDALLRGDFAAARADFERAREQSVDAYRLCRGLATAHAGLGNADAAAAEALACHRLDPARFSADIVGVATPFFTSSGSAAAGVAFFERLAAEIPDEWWVQANLASLASRMGDEERAGVARARADALAP